MPHELGTTEYKKIFLFIIQTVCNIAKVFSTSGIILNHTAAPKSPSVALHNNEEETIFSTTPTSAGQHSTGFTPSSEVINSPFNFEMHSDMIQQLTKSPGDGFLFQSRPMFDSSSMDKENDQVRGL